MSVCFLIERVFRDQKKEKPKLLLLIPVGYFNQRLL